MSVETNELYEQFVRMEWLIRRYQLDNMRKFGPVVNKHKGQGRILALLRLKPEISQKELSSILDIRSQSLGELLSKLEKAGFVTRTPSQTDKRVMEIKLTEEGKKAANRQEESSDEDYIFGCLNEEEQDALSQLFLKLNEHLSKDYGEEEDLSKQYDFRNLFASRGERPDFRESFFGGEQVNARDWFEEMNDKKKSSKKEE